MSYYGGVNGTEFILQLINVPIALKGLEKQKLHVPTKKKFSAAQRRYPKLLKFRSYVKIIQALTKDEIAPHFPSKQVL